MARIPRHFDAPAQFFIWEIDEAIAFMVCFGFGIMAGRLITFTIIGYLLGKIIAKMRNGKMDGYFIHLLWWHGVDWVIGSTGFRTNMPKNYERTLVE